MCCIFTCCGWMIDLIQRLWTFTMSCCISSAVCCALVTASMAGIALGYNYSLAEYIDLKETNVSVYLKRGVFDDEIADDMDWRRSGHMPVQGHLRDSNLMTAGPDNEEMPLRSGRRMDDSLVISDDQHKFEGSLMRLTVKPPAYKSSIEPVTSDIKMAELIAQYPNGSMEQMKAIHGLMNQRRAFTHRNIKTTAAAGFQQDVDFNGRRMMGIAPGGVPMYHGPYLEDTQNKINPARLAVPDPNIGNFENWMLGKDKIPEVYRRTMDVDYYPNNPSPPYTYPKPILFTYDMKRPTRPRAMPTTTQEILKAIAREGFDQNDPDLLKELPNDEVQMFKSQLMHDKEIFAKLRNDKIRKYGDRQFKSEEDYAEEANKGVPSRQKRQKRQLVDINTSKYPTTTSYTVKSNIFNNNNDSIITKTNFNKTILDNINKTKDSDVPVIEKNNSYTSHKFSFKTLISGQNITKNISDNRGDHNLSIADESFSKSVLITKIKSEQNAALKLFNEHIVSLTNTTITLISNLI